MVTDNEIRNRICPAAAKAVATENFAGDSTAISANTKTYTKQCIDHFKAVRKTPVLDRAADANDILTLAKLPKDKTVLGDLITAAAGVLKQVISGTSGPGAPSNANAVGGQLLQSLRTLRDANVFPGGAFGNFSADKDPMVPATGYPSTIDYNSDDATSVDTDRAKHKDPANAAIVAGFLKDALAKVSSPNFITEADKGKPTTANPSGSAAWRTLQHLRFFARNVTKLPSDIQTQVDALGKVPGFNAGSTPGTCGDGKVVAPETCDDGTDNGNPGKCNDRCDGQSSAAGYSGLGSLSDRFRPMFGFRLATAESYETSVSGGAVPVELTPMAGKDGSIGLAVMAALDFFPKRSDNGQHALSLSILYDYSSTSVKNDPLGRTTDFAVGHHWLHLGLGYDYTGGDRQVPVKDVRVQFLAGIQLLLGSHSRNVSGTCTTADTSGCYSFADLQIALEPKDVDGTTLSLGGRAYIGVRLDWFIALLEARIYGDPLDISTTFPLPGSGGQTGNITGDKIDGGVGITIGTGF